MINKNIFQTISDKDMDRKEFLQYSGLLLLGLVGLKTIASLLTKTDEPKLTVAEQHNQTNHGFGSGKYGA